MTDTCYGCEQAPIRLAGEPVSWLEGMAERLLYCQKCAEECAAGLWESDPDD
jgi:hypothetical protein